MEGRQGDGVGEKGVGARLVPRSRCVQICNRGCPQTPVSYSLPPFESPEGGGRRPEGMIGDFETASGCEADGGYDGRFWASSAWRLF